MKINKFDRDYWVKHREKALEHKWYAIGRIDILIISISSGGLYIMFEVGKFIKQSHLNTDTYLIKLSGMLFMFAIVVNFISQIAGFKANKHESKWAKFKIHEVRKIPFDKNEMGCQG